MRDLLAVYAVALRFWVCFYIFRWVRYLRHKWGLLLTVEEMIDDVLNGTPAIQLAAVASLQRLGPEAAPIFARLLDTDLDFDVRRAVEEALRALPEGSEEEKTA